MKLKKKKNLPIKLKKMFKDIFCEKNTFSIDETIPTDNIIIYVETKSYQEMSIISSTSLLYRTLKKASWIYWHKYNLYVFKERIGSGAKYVSLMDGSTKKFRKGILDTPTLEDIQKHVHSYQKDAFDFKCKTTLDGELNCPVKPVRVVNIFGDTITKLYDWNSLPRYASFASIEEKVKFDNLFKQKEISKTDLLWLKDFLTNMNECFETSKNKYLKKHPQEYYELTPQLK